MSEERGNVEVRQALLGDGTPEVKARRVNTREPLDAAREEGAPPAWGQKADRYAAAARTLREAFPAAFTEEPDDG